MSTKILNSISDEKQDFHKQYGCMNGIFQLFDRHYFITGKRVSSNHKRLLPISGAELGTERKTATANVLVRETESKTAASKVMEKNVKNTVKDESPVPIEVPRNSSQEHVKTEESRAPVISQEPKKQSSSLLYSNNQANELQNAVKNSIQKERTGLSVKTAVKEKKGGSHAMKHVDSPRPLQLPKSNYSRITGFDASPRALTKIQESSRYSMELKDTPRKDLPRFSLDGRETRDAFKSVTKFKELPRFSLDSREGTLRSSFSESRSNLLRDLRKDNINQTTSENDEPGSNKRPSNVVVKLMGLDAFPDSNSINEDQSFIPHPPLDHDFESSSTKKTKESRFLSRKEMQKDPTSPSLRNDSSLLEPSSASRFPIEPAPWRKPNGSHHPPKKSQKDSNVCAKAKITSSVYGEIEKRISDLEFKKYGKDLRALKQILEAMQKTRKRSEDQQEEQQSELERQSSSTLCNQISKASNVRRNRRNNGTQAKDPSSPRRFDSSFTIKQPNPSDNSKICSFPEIVTADTSHLLKFQNRSTFKEPSQCGSLTYKKNMNNALKPMQTSRAPQLLKAENFATMGRNSAAVSPRFQANQHRTHKQSPAATSCNEVGKARKDCSRKPTESDKSTRKTCTNQKGYKSKPSSRSETRSFANIDDSSSLQSDSNSSASQIENEVTSADSSIEITPKKHFHSKERHIAARLYEDKTLAELNVATEQPSPVSVLDATFCIEDSPSPIKKISITFQDYETLDSDEAELDSLEHSSGIARSSHDHEFGKREPVQQKHLIHSTIFPTVTADAGSWDLHESLHKSSNFEYDYIAKILSASGLLKNMGSFLTTTQPQSTGQLINPEFFHVLEQAEQNPGLQNHIGKTTTLKRNRKIHRRMLFDTVNEIIVCRLVSEGSFMLRKRIKTEQELLREIFLEMDSLQAKTDCCLDDPDGLGCILSADMKRQPDDWSDHQSEIPTLVLDIERLIFKDLITEVLNGENLCLHDMPQKQRKLFV